VRRDETGSDDDRRPAAGLAPAARRPKELSPTLLRGRYVLRPSPCTTEPCLPGVAYALETADGCYYLTVGGRWSGDRRSWDAYVPAEGEEVAVSGRVGERRDVRGDVFRCVEVDALRSHAAR
jgi:hypothetical protein